MRNDFARSLAIGGAALGWSALALQLVLTLNTMAGQGALEGLWSFFGYFTVIANIFAAAVLTRAAMWRGSSRLEFAAATTMILVGVVYSLLLRDTWNPQGWQKVADIALHDAMPLIVAIFWLVRPHGHLRSGDVAATLVLPIGYCGYALLRGAFDGWYPYGFMDVGQFGVMAVARNCAALGAAFLVMALGLALLDRRLR